MGSKAAARVRASAAIFFLAIALTSLRAAAQVTVTEADRVVEGRVVASSGAVVDHATVYLKNVNTLMLTTCFTEADGTFHFGHVGIDSDYEVWAEKDNRKSKVKTISVFKRKKEFKYELRLP
jgi:hypothetical protein